MRAENLLRRRQARLAYAMVAPASLLIALIYVVPMIAVVLASLTDYTLISDYWEWVGLDNYKRMFGDAQFGNALRNTAIYAAIFLPCAFVIPLLLAISIQKRKQFRSFFEILYFMPVTSTLTAMAFIEMDVEATPED